jgi:hypothetical protein
MAGLAPSSLGGGQIRLTVEERVFAGGAIISERINAYLVEQV